MLKFRFKIFSLISFILFLGNTLSIFSAEDSLETGNSIVEKLKYKQQPGLALAASKIFFSDKKYSFSGFGEFNYVPYQSNLNRNLGDLELYYSGLYRFANFFGYRFTDKLIWNSEFQIEYLHDKNLEHKYEIVVEAFFDYIFDDHFKMRFGYYPLTIGYVNNNDEPVMFYSVNRSEVERIILPSTWIEFGTMFYGNINNDWSYALGFSQGLNSENYLSGTWIRQGREIRFGVPNSISVNPQLNYTGVEDLTLSVSGYFGNSGNGNSILQDEKEDEIKANINLLSGYGKYDWQNFRFIAVGVVGKITDTDKLYDFYQTNNQISNVIGEQVYGYLFEVGCDIMPYLNGKINLSKGDNWFYNKEDFQLILFSRFERLNTHHNLNQKLIDFNRDESNLEIWTLGVNLNTSKNFVFKTNYQYRQNHFSGDINPFKNIFELGIGFIY